MRFIRTILLLAPILAHLAFAADSPKNPVGIDFSFAGFQGGGHPLPDVAATISVTPTGADDTALLQSAIDHIATLSLDNNGFRGAILLRPGRFLVQGQLRLNASGIVLRGSGANTVIVAQGISRRTLIQVGADHDPIISLPINLADYTIEAGDRKLWLSTTEGLTVGTHIVIRRPSTAEWIKAPRHERPPRNLRRPARRLETRITRSRLGPHHHSRRPRSKHNRDRRTHHLPHGKIHRRRHHRNRHRQPATPQHRHRRPHPRKRIRRRQPQRRRALMDCHRAKSC